MRRQGHCADAVSGVTVFWCVQTDISEVVIKQMTVRHGQYSNMTYRVSDCRKMPEFMDCSFGHVLDKGGCEGTARVERGLLKTACAPKQGQQHNPGAERVSSRSGLMPVVMRSVHNKQLL